MLSEEHKYRPYVTPKSMAKSSTTCLKPFNIASGKSYSTYHYNVYALLSSFFHVLYSALPQVPLHLSLQQLSAEPEENTTNANNQDVIRKKLFNTHRET